METLLQCLATHLGQSSDPDLILRICKLIRFSPKDFDGVDVVLPPLQVLKKCLEGEELNVKNYEALLGTELANLALLNDAVSCEWRFSDISVKSEKILLRLDRSFVLSQQMKRLALEGHRFEARPDRRRVRIVNCELSLSSGCQTSVYSQLAEVRCNQVSREYVKNMYKGRFCLEISPAHCA
jgi:hypothetical protein